MKICKVKPNRCGLCKSALENYEIDYDCSKCEDNLTEYELISVGHSDKAGDWAMVLKDGIIKRVELHRVWDVKDPYDVEYMTKNFA